MSGDEEEMEMPDPGSEEAGGGADRLPDAEAPAEDAGAEMEAEPADPEAADGGRDVEAAGAGEGGEAEGEEAEPKPLIQLTPDDLRLGIEAILFSTGEPIPIRELAEVFETSVHDVREAVEELRLRYVNEGHSYRIEDIAGGVQILTLSKFEPWIRKYLTAAREGRLSPAAFETLAVIAYKQPITKASLEAIRGVQCGPILKTLLDRNLIKVVGREESLGKPLLYGTTKRFLESFGIGSITNLPQPEIDLPGLASPEQN
jgi:segregation and condensation protein B